MEIKDLEKYIAGNNENKILYKMLDSFFASTENEVLTISQIIYAYVIKDGKEGDRPWRNEAFNNLISLNSDSLGGIGAMCAYKAITESYKHNDYRIEELYLECGTYINKYITKSILKGKFVEALHSIYKAIGISDAFHDALIDYFIENSAELNFYFNNFYRQGL